MEAAGALWCVAKKKLCLVCIVDWEEAMGGIDVVS